MPPDHELLTRFVAQGSDAAFRNLVARHVDLVFATAFRQLGDRGSAEEVTQNVFVALARKAPRLAGRETLAGWLHRTTVLECKARIRSELRRRQRESVAAELATIQAVGATPAEILTPLLDEGLLGLSDPDREALMLRFWQDRNLRDIGATLGVTEEAARKRVSRALERLTQFFKNHGFAVPSGAGCASLLTQAGQAAPAALADAVAAHALGAAGSAGGLSTFVFKLMALSKTQTTLVCALLAALPLAYQWRAESRLARERSFAEAQFATARGRLTSLEAELAGARADWSRSRAETIRQEARAALLAAQREGRARRPEYRWNDGSPLVRVPKALLERLDIPAVRGVNGDLSFQIKEALQMTAHEEQAVQEAVRRLLGGYYALQAMHMKPVEPTESELQGMTPNEVRVFALEDINSPFGELRAEFFAELEPILGTDRARLFRQNLRGWMPLSDHYGGLNSGLAIVPFKHRVRMLKPDPGSGVIPWGMSVDQHGGIFLSHEPGQITRLFHAYIQDWISLATQPRPEPGPQEVP